MAGVQLVPTLLLTALYLLLPPCTAPHRTALHALLHCTHTRDSLMVVIDPRPPR